MWLGFVGFSRDSYCLFVLIGCFGVGLWGLGVFLGCDFGFFLFLCLCLVGVLWGFFLLETIFLNGKYGV